MRVRVRLFARQREIAGTREVVLEVADGAKIEDAWAAVVALHPGLADGRPYVRFALNGVYASPGTPLAEDDEVACIPPVSGGSGEGGGGTGGRQPCPAHRAAGARRPVRRRPAPIGSWSWRPPRCLPPWGASWPTGSPRRPTARS